MRSFKLAKSVSVVTFISGIGIVVGFAREVVIAVKLGATSGTDAFLVASTIPTLVHTLLIGGALSIVLVPVITEYLTEGRDEQAWRTVNTTINSLLLSVGTLVILGMMNSRKLVRVIAPGFDSQTAQLAAYMTVILLPVVLLTTVSAVLSAVLNCRHSFAIPALRQPVYNLVIISSLFILFRHFGVASLAWGALAGGVCQLILVGNTLRKTGFGYRFVLALEDEGLKRLILLSLPTFLATGVGQFAAIVERMLASLVPSGSIAALNFASKIWQLPVVLISSSIPTVLFANFSAHVAERNFVELRTNLSRALRLLLFVLIPLALWLIIFRDPIIQLVFRYGAFDERAVAMTSIALGYYAVGMPSQVINPLFSTVLFALQDTKTAAILSVLSLVLNILLDLLLVNPLQHAGLALGAALSAVANTMISSLVVRTRLRYVEDKSLLLAIARISGASLAMAAPSWFLMNSGWMSSSLTTAQPNKVALVALLIAGTVVAVSTYVVASLGLGSIKIRAVRDMLLQWRGLRSRP